MFTDCHNWYTSKSYLTGFTADNLLQISQTNSFGAALETFCLSYGWSSKRYWFKRFVSCLSYRIISKCSKRTQPCCKYGRKTLVADRSRRKCFQKARNCTRLGGSLMLKGPKLVGIGYLSHYQGWWWLVGTWENYSLRTRRRFSTATVPAAVTDSTTDESRAVWKTPAS